MQTILQTLRQALNRRHLKHFIAAAIIDAIILVLSYMAAFSARSVITPVEMANGIRYIMLDVLLTIVVFNYMGIYRRLWSRTSGHDMTIIINAVAITTSIIFVINLPMEPRPLPLSIILLANALSISGFIAVRYRSRLFTGLDWRWRAIWRQEFPKTSTRVLIVGAGQSGQELALRLRRRTPGNDYTVVGFVDDDVEKMDMYVEGAQVLGNRTDLAYLVEKHKVDLIIVAIHNISGPNFRDILSNCEKTRARIKVAPDIFAMVNSERHAPLLRDVLPEDLLGRSTISRHENIDLSPVMRRVVLVTGAAGSIGSELARQLPSYEPTQLLLLDCNESGLHDLTIHLKAKYPQLEICPILADITCRPALQAVFERYRPQVVFHAAAYKHVPILQEFPNEAVRVNIGGTRNLAQLAQAHQVGRFVLISTDKAVNPTSVMGASKRICELMIHALSRSPDNQTIFTSVRFGNVLGSRGSVVVTFNEQISRGGPVTITHRDMTRYFMTIPEAVNLVIHAACMTRGGETFLLKMGEVVRIVDLAERMIRLRGLRPYDDVPIEFTGVRPGEKLHEQLYDGSAESASETAHPGIIQLRGKDLDFEAAALMAWVDSLMENGLDTSRNALFQLLWGMTASEKYAIIENSAYADESLPEMTNGIPDNGAYNLHKAKTKPVSGSLKRGNSQSPAPLGGTN